MSKGGGGGGGGGGSSSAGSHCTLRSGSNSGRIVQHPWLRNFAVPLLLSVEGKKPARNSERSAWYLAVPVPHRRLLKMPKHFSIELYFDTALENQVLKIWNVLGRRQISTQLMEIEARPHITVFSGSNFDPSKFQNALRNFVTKQQPLAVSLTAIGSFANENVLFLVPTPTISLLSFQDQLYELLKREGVEVGDIYHPGNWVPHCSVAEEVPRRCIADAFCLLRDFKLPLTGYVFDIGIVESPPVREHYSFSMGGAIA